MKLPSGSPQFTSGDFLPFSFGQNPRIKTLTVIVLRFPPAQGDSCRFSCKNTNVTVDRSVEKRG